MALFQRYNNENILSRAVIAGLLDVLNNNIKYNQVWGNDPIEDIEQIKVPWYLNQAGDERFMQDFYTHYDKCTPPRPVDGNFDMIPRGIITYTGSGIDAERITSRYVQGRYVKEIDGKLEGFVSYLYSIPLTVRFDCELWVDTYTTALKIEQELREVFYKNVTYYVYFKGMRIGCTAGFPEEVGIDKNFNYGFETENKIKMNFQLEVESYQPVFDPTTEMPARNKINKLTYRLYEATDKNDGDIRITTPGEKSILPKGNPVWIEWSFTKEGGIMRDVDILWAPINSNDPEIIEQTVPNHEYYIWNIPPDFTDYIDPNIIWEERSRENSDSWLSDASTIVTINREPKISIIPDLNTKQIKSDSFHIFSDGYFSTVDFENPGHFEIIESSINIQLEMKNDAGEVFYTNKGDIWVNILNNKVNHQNPVGVANDASIFFPGPLNPKNISLYVTNSVNPDVFGLVQDIKII
jgi:hypothetical protein